MIELDGIKVSYDCAGSGDNIVLLHGWGGSALSFKPVFDYLSKSYRVYAIDFPGFGNSDLPPSVWGVEDYGNFILKLFTVMLIEKTNVIAHSFGGRVAIWLAANYPEKINKLVLVDSAGIKPKRPLKYYFKVTVAKIGKLILQCPIFERRHDILLNKLYRLIGSKDYLQQTGIMRSILVKVVNEDLREILHKITAPTLLVWGEEDKDVPVSSAKIMEKEIQDSGLIIFKGAGHFSYLDKFSDFCLIVSKFFTNTEGAENYG